ncbi:MAG: hypothetical protein WC661_14995 [Opitutaceae bacterium]|jgi:alpha-tubulin suppressor-like RCC1 family protein
MNTIRISPIVRSLIVGLAFAANVLALRADTVAAGKYFAGAVIDGDTLYTWGANSAGQLGHSSGVSPVAFPKSISGSWKAVAMGDDFTLAIDQDDRLWAWGSNVSGQLGIGSTVDSSVVPVLVALPSDATVRRVVAGEAHAMALVDRGATTGLVYAWGANVSGQLGQGNTSTSTVPVQFKLASGVTPAFQAVAATSASSFAIAADGSLWACGFNARGELGLGQKVNAKNISLTTPARIGKSRAWTAVAGGAHHVLALQGNNLFAWGDNGQGQLGIGSKAFYVTKPTQIKATVKVGKKKVLLLWSSISAGPVHSCAITTDGVGYAWGSNLTGALALPVKSIGLNAYNTPQLVFPLSATPVVRLVCGYDFTVALNSAGDVFAVGGNTYGQLGDGNATSTINTTPSFSSSQVGGASLTAGQPILASATLGVNTAFSTTVSVTNTGGTDQANSYVVRLYLSNNVSLDSSDRLLVERTVAGPLVAGASTAVTFGPSELTLPEIAAGSYYLISQVVTAGVADPYLPSNGSAIAMQLVGPDLTLEQVGLANTVIDATTTSFNAVTLTLANRNRGLIPAGKMIRVEAYLSTDDSLNPGGDVFLSAYTQTVASPGFASSETLPLNLGNLAVPAGLTGGSYHLFFTVNRDNAISETGSATNTLSVPVTIASADLAVSSPVLPSVSGTPKTIGANTTIGTISTYVQNQGTLAYSANYTLELYLSADTTYDASDLLIATKTGGGSLSSLASTLADWSNVTIPNYPPGAAYLIARVKLPDDQPDRNQANNTAATAVNIQGPSLTISDFVFPGTTSIAAGASLGNVSYKLTNATIGAISSGQSVTIEVFLSEDGALDRSADVLIDQYTYTGGLAAGANVILPTTSRPLSLPANTRNGIYQLLFVATVNGTSTVTAVSSTPVSQMVAVGALDVSITSPALSTTELGTNATLPQTTVSVKNSGGFAVPAGMSVNLYLSVDGTVDQNDTLLGTQQLAVQLDAGATRTVTFSGLPVPDIGQGSYKLVAELVLPSSLIDLDASNNVASTPVTLTRPTLAITDLVVGTSLDLDTPPATFSNVSFSLVNDSRGDIPAATTLTYNVYLSRDTTLSASDTLLTTGTVTGGIPGTLTSGTNKVAVAPFDLVITSGIVGGNYYLLFVVNADGAAKLASSQTIQVAQLVILTKSNAPGNALDYGTVTFGGDVEWHSVADTRASGGQAFEASGLATGQTATLAYVIDGPTMIAAPWKILAETTDTLSYAIDGVVQKTISGYIPSFSLPNAGPSPITVPAGRHTVTWTYTQNSTNTTSYARLDLDMPTFITSGDDSWIGVTDVTAPVLGNYSRSPAGLVPGQQASLAVDVIGPALVSFWWRSESTSVLDTLGFSIDGVLAGLPTTTDYVAATPAVISGSVAWRKVAFLVPAGPHTLSWTYSQGSSDAAAYAGVDGLQVLTPIPSTSVLNRDNTPATHGDVPLNNTDLAITSVTAPTGTYLLDDANGTSRLPINIHVSSVGADFSAMPTWDSSKIEMRLSTNRTAGDGDDIILGSYAHMTTLQNGAEVIFDAEINLPLDIPTGDYYLIVKVAGPTPNTVSDPTSEFTLANNTVIVGPGYHIERAPNLVLDSSAGDTALSAVYPYHPEDSVYIHYTIGNTGLGSVLPTDKFKVRIELMAVAKTATSIDLLGNTVVKTYADQEYSAYLPEAGGATPNGGTLSITQFLDLPGTRDTMVALGIIPSGTPEDDAKVYNADNLAKLATYSFYFRVTLDVGDAVAESSETNTYQLTGLFSIVSLPSLTSGGGHSYPFETFGSYVGQSAFDTFFADNPGFVAGAVFESSFDPGTLNPASTGSDQFTGYFWKYVLYGDPGEVDRLVGRMATSAGQTGLLYQEGVQNGQVTLNYSPFIGQTFNMIAFDFNIRAIDATIEVQVMDDHTPSWQTILTLTPPYLGASGVRSLSGYGGLKDNPLVLSVDGNSTDVQQTYAARIVVRDSQSLQTRMANNGGTNPNPRMRLKLGTTVAVPVTPSGLAAVASGTSVKLNWTGSLPVITVTDVDTQGGAANFQGGSFAVERSQDPVNPLTGVVDTGFVAIGSSTNSTFTDVAPGSTVTNTYRVRAITSGGSTNYSATTFILIP